MGRIAGKPLEELAGIFYMLDKISNENGIVITITCSCAKEELPLDKTTLWEGTLTGGYCQVRASAPIQDWSPFAGGGLMYSIHVELFESEDAYHAFK